MVNPYGQPHTWSTYSGSCFPDLVLTDIPFMLVTSVLFEYQASLIPQHLFTWMLEFSWVRAEFRGGLRDNI